MALTVKLDAKQTGIGLALPEAYARISGFSFTADGVFHVGVDVFVSEAARRGGARPAIGLTVKLEGFDFGRDLGVKRMLYQLLKVNELFAAGVDN